MLSRLDPTAASRRRDLARIVHLGRDLMLELPAIDLVRQLLDSLGGGRGNERFLLIRGRSRRPSELGSLGP